MTVEAVSAIRSGRTGGRVLSALAALVMAVVFAIAFQPTAALAAEATDTCNPTASNGCVNGILQDAGKTPISGVTVTLSGAESATTTTGADGKWAFKVSADGDYTVTIDQSVASQHQLAAHEASVTIKKSDFSKSRGVVRFDQASAANGASSTAGAGSGSGASGSSNAGSSSNASGGSAGQSGGSSGSNIGSRIWQQLFSGVI